jgi:hypothetical protein
MPWGQVRMQNDTHSPKLSEPGQIPSSASAILSILVSPSSAMAGQWSRCDYLRHLLDY